MSTHVWAMEDGAPQSLSFGPRAMEITTAGSEISMNSTRSIPAFPGQFSNNLRYWAGADPERSYLAERAANGDWDTITYGGAGRAVDALSAALLDEGLTPARPIASLAGNSVNHILLMLAAMQIGTPFSSLSEAYSLKSLDFAKLRHAAGLLRPAGYYVGAVAPFTHALATIPLTKRLIFVDEEASTDQERAARAAVEAASGRPVVVLKHWRERTGTEAVAEAYKYVGPHSIAKILMTSGSTGRAKGVIVTQDMIWANGWGVDQAWPFLGAEPPILVDWLPLSHTFASNFTLSAVTRHGGTLYIDKGSATPSGIDVSLANLLEIRPTVIFNVPRGFELFVEKLQHRLEIAKAILSNVKFFFYGGAHLTPDLWTRLKALAFAATGRDIPILTAFGSTEAGPVATIPHCVSGPENSLGDPISGASLRFVDSDGKLEMRVKGRAVTPGYYNDPESSERAFDEQGFYRMGDAIRFIEARPENGLLYDGRTAENFKLQTGSWVHVSNLRADVVNALSPFVSDLALTGHNRDRIGAIAFLNTFACRDHMPADDPHPAMSPTIHAILKDRLADHNATNSGASRRIDRIVLIAGSPSVEQGELTDKGYLNQQAVLNSRADLVELLYSERSNPAIIAM